MIDFNNSDKYKPYNKKHTSSNQATSKETHRRRKKLTKENKQFLKLIGLLK